MKPLLSILALFFLLASFRAENEMVYLIHAQQATFTLYPGEKYYASLVLKGVGQGVAYFSDTTQRGTVAVEDFVVEWNDRENHFHPVPPRIALVDANGVRQRVELRHLTYDVIKEQMVGDLYLLDPILIDQEVPVTLLIERGHKRINR